MNRCPSCFGTKQVRKLGNMLGDCDFCEGKGQVTDEKLATLPVAPALPAGNATLPQTSDYYIKQAQADQKARIKNANVAYMNQPVNVDPKRPNDAASYLEPKPVIPLDPNIKQAPDHRLAPKPLPEHELMKLRAQIQPREVDVMDAQKIADEPASVDVSAPVTSKNVAKKAKAKGIANAKKERKAAGGT